MVGTVTVTLKEDTRSFKVLDLVLEPDENGDLDTNMLSDSRFVGRVEQLELWPDATDAPPDTYVLTLSNSQLEANAINVLKDGSVGESELGAADTLFLSNTIHSYFMTGSYRIQGTFENVIAPVKVHLRLILGAV
jgi:hypothetical protein